MKACIECKSNNLIKRLTDGDIVCQDCGIVNDTIIDDSPEWLNVNSTVTMDRCTPNIDNHTLVSQCGDAKMQRTLIRMHSDYNKTKINKVKTMYSSICTSNNLSQEIAYKSSQLYEKIFNTRKFDGSKHIKRGKKLKGIKAACLYFVLQDSENTFERRSPEYVSEITGVDISNINEAKKLIIKQLDMYTKLPKNNLYIDLINIYTDSLKNYKNFQIPKELINTMYSTLNNCLEKGLLLEKVPKSVAAGCIWYVINHYSDLAEKKIFTKKDIKDCTKVSPVTLENVSKEINKVI